MGTDWHRKTTWSEADQAEFFARLKRSRTAYHKSQYLYIQGRELADAGLLEPAITLFDKMATEYPEETFWLASAWLEKAACLAKLGNFDQATTCYRQAAKAQRKSPGHWVGVAREFGKFVVIHELTNLYQEAFALLDNLKLASGTIDVPIEVYEENGIRAIILNHKGEHEKASKFAMTALVAAAKDKSNFRYHPNFGLVKDHGSKFFRTIEEIAGRNLQGFAT